MNQDPSHPVTAAPERSSPPPWYRLAFFSLLGGSTSLIPLPFVDDWTLDWIRRRMILELGGPIRLPEEAVGVLLKRGERPLSGCLNLLIRTPFSLLIYLVKRLFRKIVYILAVKESTDRASAVFHEGYLLAAAARRPDLAPEVRAGRPEAVRQLAYAFVETFRQTDTSPVRYVVAHTLKGSRRLLFLAARRLRQMLPKTTRLDAEPTGWEAREESLLGQLSQDLADSLERQRNYFANLEIAFIDFASRRQLLASPSGRPNREPQPVFIAEPDDQPDSARPAKAPTPVRTLEEP